MLKLMQWKWIMKWWKKWLLARGYPVKLVERTSAMVLYKNRAQFLTKSQASPPKFYPPLYKCPPPPQYKLLKHIVLENYHILQSAIPAPWFIPLKHPTLRDKLVRTKLMPTDNQLSLIHATLNEHTTSHVTAGQLPHLGSQNARTKRCNHSKCVTCKHLNCSKYFTSTRTGTYTIRHNFNCTSRNLIYLITCNVTNSMLDWPLHSSTLELTTTDQIFSTTSVSTFQFPWPLDHSLEHLSV